MLRSFVEFGKRGNANQDTELERQQKEVNELSYLNDKIGTADNNMFCASFSWWVETNSRIGPYTL